MALGGAVDPAAVHRLSESAGGNALFLRELIVAAVDSGALRLTRGIWRLDGALAISSRLIEIVDARLGDLSDDVARALALVALGEPLGAAVFQHMDAETDLERWRRSGSSPCSAAAGGSICGSATRSTARSCARACRRCAPGR